MTEERSQAERFAELFRAVYLARTMARLPPGRADDLIAGLRTSPES